MKKWRQQARKANVIDAGTPGCCPARAEVENRRTLRPRHRRAMRLPPRLVRDDGTVAEPPPSDRIPSAIRHSKGGEVAVGVEMRRSKHLSSRDKPQVAKRVKRQPWWRRLPATRTK